MSLKPEQCESIALVDWFHLQFPELADDFHHFANERKCSPQYGKILKRMGVKKGVADFFLALPQDEFSGLWIELKVGNRRPTKEQEYFLNRKLERGYLATVSVGFEAARDMILFYLHNYLKERNKFKLKNCI